MKNKILITGASGLLGRFLCQKFLISGDVVIGLVREHRTGLSNLKEIKIDITNEKETLNILNIINPDIIIHSAGLTSVELCQKYPELAQKIHISATETILNYAKNKGSKFVHISTDHLWDGKIKYVSEDEPLCPVNVYGKTKAIGEQLVFKNLSSALVIRTNFFGEGLPWRKSLSDWIIEKLSKKETITAFTDVYFTPIPINLLADSIEILLNQSKSGIYHIAGSERISKFDFAVSIARLFNFNERLIKAGKISDVLKLVKRPLDMSLSVKKFQLETGISLPDLNVSINSLLKNNIESVRNE